MKILLPLLILVLLVFQSCRKDEAYFIQPDDSLLGNYEGVETYSLIPTGQPVYFDTIYDMDINVERNNNFYNFTRSEIGPHGYLSDSSFNIAVPAFSENVYNYQSNSNAIGNSKEIRFKNDSLFIIFRDYYAGGSTYWNFNGEKK